MLVKQAAKMACSRSRIAGHEVRGRGALQDLEMREMPQSGIGVGRLIHVVASAHPEDIHCVQWNCGRSFKA